MADDVNIPAAPFPLRRQLPSDVVVRSSSWIAAYRNYPVFSAPWLWRRTMLFGAGAFAIGFAQSVLTWHLVDRATAALFTICVVLIWEVIVTAGPALATLVRHRQLPYKRERVAVAVAILVGVAISFAAQYAANRLSMDLLIPRAIEAGTLPRPVPPVPNPFLYGFVIVWQVALFLVLGGGFALRIYFNEPEGWRTAQREREIEALREQKSEVDIRLAVLQAQVEPHFLFNTLASVHSLIRKDPQRAEATIEALVDHLRATLPKLRADVGSLHSTLAEQLEVCASYLAVMQVRMGERLRYEIDISAAVREHPFPPFMLISLVENAIKHGVEPSAVGGSITIRAAVVGAGEERSLEVSVEDDGMGLRPGLGDGVGLANLRAQLAAKFGARGRFSIVGRADRGVCATITVPCLQERGINDHEGRA